MNDKIKRITQEHLINSEYTEFGWQECHYYLFHPDEMENFVSQIVKDCISKIETYQIPVGNSPAGEMACDWTYDALKEIRNDIKKEWGLNED